MGQFKSGKAIPQGIPRLQGWMTSAEASVLLNVTKARVSQMVKAGKLGQPFRIGPVIILQAQAVKDEYERRLANPRHKKHLRKIEFPNEYIPAAEPEIHETLKEAVSAYLIKEDAV